MIKLVIHFLKTISPNSEIDTVYVENEKVDDRSLTCFDNFQQTTSPNLRKRIFRKRITTIEESEFIFDAENKKNKSYTKIATFSKGSWKNFPNNIDIHNEIYKYR